MKNVKKRDQNKKNAKNVFYSYVLGKLLTPIVPLFTKQQNC